MLDPNPCPTTPQETDTEFLARAKAITAERGESSIGHPLDDNHDPVCLIKIVSMERLFRLAEDGLKYAEMSR